eukprot:SAG11_NODE_30961_length_296_cov_0.517766_2_plen_42_part_01
MAGAAKCSKTEADAASSSPLLLGELLRRSHATDAGEDADAAA